MASGVHAVALRLKQAKKKKMMQDHYAQQQLGSRPPPPRETLHGSLRVGDPPIRSPRRTHQPGGWDAGSDVSFQDRPSGIEYRQKADKAYKKWLKKQHDEALDFRKSYIAASESARKVDLLLWFGLAVLVTGTIVSFVGLGEKGFKSQHLRFLGPVLCGIGLALVLIRVFVCCCGKKVKKVASSFSAKEQLAKMAQVQQIVAVQSIGETRNIPSIHVDPSISCESGMKSVATGLTELSPCTPDVTSETEPLISPQWTTAVIETEKPIREKFIHFEEPDKSTLSPMSPGSCSSTSPLRPN